MTFSHLRQKQEGTSHIVFPSLKPPSLFIVVDEMQCVMERVHHLILIGESRAHGGEYSMVSGGRGEEGSGMFEGSKKAGGEDEGGKPHFEVEM